MPAPSKALAFSAAAVTAGLAVWGLLRGSISPSSPRAAPVTRALHRAAAEPAILGRAIAGRPDTGHVTPAEFQEMLYFLGSLDSPAIYNEDTQAARREFAEDMVSRLGLSPEMLELKTLAAARHFYWFEVLLDEAMQKRLKDPDSGELRARLLSCGWANTAGWWHAAGQGCTPAEFAALAPGLKEGRMREAVTLGQYVTVAKTDPLLATTAVAWLAASSQDSSLAFRVLRQGVDQLPPGTDFAALERGLPPQPTPTLESLARGMVLARWGLTDPAAAARYVMASQDRISPEEVAVAAGMLDESHLSQTVAFFQAFPPGPYYDGPVSRLLPLIRGTHPELARELAARLPDPNAGGEGINPTEAAVPGTPGGDNGE